MKNIVQKNKSKFAYRTAPLVALALIFAAAFCSSTSWADVKLSTLNERLIRSSESFENVLSNKSGAIPRSVLAKAQGIVIFRQYGAGFIWGGKGGFGVAMERQHDGQWGPPAFLSAGAGSFGLQIGVQRMDTVFLFMTRDALKVFDRENFKIGVDVAAAAGEVGVDAQAKVGPPVLVYSDNAGLYAGATFEGGMLQPDKEANEKFYQKEGIHIGEILRGEHVNFPSAAEELRHDLESYESSRSKY